MEGMDYPSPFSSRIGTNYAATDEEMDTLAALLVNPTSRLTELEERIDSTQALLDSLRKQHEQLKGDIEGHKALMVPTRRLPIDIMREIFLQCLPRTHNAVISRHHCPVLLTQICSGWRHIAINTPSLWTSIHVPLPSDTRNRGSYSPAMVPSDPPSELILDVAHKRARAITEWLGRSGDCTLDITLYDRSSTGSSEVYDIILDTLIPFSHRWGCITFETPTFFLSKVTALKSDAFPRLHSLTIRGMYTDSNTPSTTFWTTSGVIQAPNLRRITYANVSENITSFRLQWGQLTSLSLSGSEYPEPSYMSVEKLANLLTCCPLLRSCRFEVLGRYPVHYFSNPISQSPPSQPINIPTSIALPYLTEFIVRGCQSDLTGLIDALELPALDNLELHAINIKYAGLLSLLNRTAHTLCKLSINANGLTRQEFFTYMRSCPNLSQLTLCYNFEAPDWPTDPPPHSPPESSELKMTLDEDFLQKIFASPPEEVLLPKLTQFDCHSAPDFSDDCLLKLLKARNSAAVSGITPPVSKVKKVSAFFGNSQTKPMLAELKTLAEDGVDCRLTYSPPMPTAKQLPTHGIPDSTQFASEWGAPTF